MLKILIRATNWLGDAVMSLPAIRAVRDGFPGASISVLAKPWVAALYERERAIDRILPIEGSSGARDWVEKLKLAGKLRRERFDLAILLPNSFESAAILRLAGAKRIIGYARDGRSPLLTDAIPVPRKGEIPQHERFYYLELLRRAGLVDAMPDVPEIHLEGIAEARVSGERLFNNLGISLPVIGISPGAAYGGAKRWLPERFAESAVRIAREIDATVAVFGSAAEKALCEEVAQAAHGRNLASFTSLRDFIDMTAACHAFLSNDSGAMHVAAALRIPSVTIFGPTDEVATGPCSATAQTIRKPVDCAPCLKRECPIDHRCMTGVTADDVVVAIRSAMTPSPEPSMSL